MVRIINILSTLTMTGFLFTAAAEILSAPSYMSLTLSEIEYESIGIYSTPPHLATFTASVSFVLENPSLYYSTNCSATENYLGSFHGDRVYTCDMPEGSGVESTFKYDRLEHSFDVNQTWAAGEDVVYLLRGHGRVDLACESSVWRNPNWTIGDIYSIDQVECGPGTLTLS